MNMPKSSTDQFWNQRAVTEADPTKVNIADDVQRQLETAFILQHLPAGSRVLEVGAGNGHLTNILRRQAGFVDAFDYAENMVEQAKRLQGETNNRFFHDSVLAPAAVQPPYDVVVCVRVLINLRNLEEQQRAFDNMTALLGPRGRLILVEGFLDGFNRLNEVRAAAGIEALKPAPINFYSPLSAWTDRLRRFQVAAEFNSGTFDFLTRVVYPALAGAQHATGPSEFHQLIHRLAQTFDPEPLKSLARLRGFVLVGP
jgi:SAM-dependent methyltransferase